MIQDALINAQRRPLLWILAAGVVLGIGMGAGYQIVYQVKELIAPFKIVSTAEACKSMGYSEKAE